MLDPRYRAMLILAAALFLCVSTSRSEPPKALADVRVFAVYEPVMSRQDVELLARVHPDFVCRGWFKWHHTPDWQAYAPLAQACAEKGILLQGGITLSAIYPGENGMDDAAFRDFATHGTDGKPYHCRMADNGGWYQLSLYNPNVIAYLKREVRLQIDAGAVGIWYDEIEGFYDWNPTEGYDPYACAAFRDWLIRKYCGGQGWREDDPRWQTQFGIDLARHGGTIRTFDYLRHLQTTPGKDGQPLATNPAQGHPRAWATSANPLYREWGFAWDRKAAGTFRFDTVAALFADILADADRYARERYGRTLINTYNHNGTARPGVAFLQPHNGAQPPLRHGRLDGRASYLTYYEDLIADAAGPCPGQPVVFFVDWPGETDRLVALPRADQTHFFRIYIPEAYAAGGEFALPLRGYSYVAARQGTLAALARMADFYREYAPFLRGSKPGGADGLVRDEFDRLTVRLRSTAGGTAVHIVSHAFSTRDVWPSPRTNLCVTLPWSAAAPDSAFAVSPDFPDQRPVPVSLKDGQLTLDVGAVTCSALVLLPKPDALRPITGTAPSGTHIVDPQGRAMAVARDGRFTLWLPPSEGVSLWRRLLGREARATRELECLETGERQPARDGAAFAAPPSGGFASGLLLDGFGIPLRHTALTSGTRRWHTDAWGRYRVPLAHASAAPLTVCGEDGAAHALPLSDRFTARRLLPARTRIGDFAASQGGYWANWPDKERRPGVIALARERHQERDALRCTFSPSPSVPWSNINSPAFTLEAADAVEVGYAGDGTPRTVHAVLHANGRFYRAPLDLSATGWTVKRIALAKFRDDQGAPFDPAAHTGTTAFQLAPAGLGTAPATLWLHRVALVTDTPAVTLWQSDGAFDTVDVDHLRADHRPQPPPPRAADRQPLARFTDPAARTLANWAEKSAADKPLVAIERMTPPDAPPFLRITLAAGECAWGNANIPLPADKLAGKNGLALRLRSSPATEDVTVALHTSVDGKAAFFQTEVEAGDTWSEQTVRWAEFRTESGRAFAPQAGAFLTLQICRPPHALKRAIEIDLEAVDAFTETL